MLVAGWSCLTILRTQEIIENKDIIKLGANIRSKFPPTS